SGSYLWSRPVKAYQCDLCPKSYSAKRNLGDHKRNIHGKHAQPYRCDLCNKVYKNKHVLQTHVSGMHNAKNVKRVWAPATSNEDDNALQETRYSCKFCEKSYVTKTRHRKECMLGPVIESKNKTLRACIDVAGDTGLVFHNAEQIFSDVTLPQHQMRGVRRRPTQFHTGRGHQNYIKTEDFRGMAFGAVLPTGELTLRYKCTQCDKSYKSEFNLKVHKRNIHNPESGPVQCQICHSLFKNPHSLQCHNSIRHKGRAASISDTETENPSDKEPENPRRRGRPKKQ
ncbi:hypothetical protein B566_EDAN019002, partial [Ephemera danica]